MGFKLVQTIEAQVKKTLFVSHVLFAYICNVFSNLIALFYQFTPQKDVGWSVLDVALSPDGGHLVYSSWSDSLHQVQYIAIMI